MNRTRKLIASAAICAALLLVWERSFWEEWFGVTFWGDGTNIVDATADG